MNNMTIKEMKEARAAESHSYVFVSLHKDPRDVCFYLRVKNHGKTGAIINRLQIAPIIKLVDIEEKSNFLERIILAPNQTLRIYCFGKMGKKLVKRIITWKLNIQWSGMQISGFHEQYGLCVVQYAHQMGYPDKEQYT